MTLARFSRPSCALVFVGLVVACGGSGDAQLGGLTATTGVTGGSAGGNATTGGQISGNTGGNATTGGNTVGGNDSGGANGNGGSNGNAGSKGNAGNNGNGGSDPGAGGMHGTGGTPANDSGTAGSSAPDASAGGGAGTSTTSDAGVGNDSAAPVQTVACPVAPVITPLAPLPEPPIRLPLCLLPEKCCYSEAKSDGTCAAQTAACGANVDSFVCDGPEDCTDGSICCGHTPAVITTQAIIAPISITNTVCTSAQKCTSLVGKTVCHDVSDCGPGAVCAAGGGLPPPFKVCNPGVTTN